jgi:hypothetical protein
MKKRFNEMLDTPWTWRTYFEVCKWVLAVYAAGMAIWAIVTFVSGKVKEWKENRRSKEVIDEEE